MRSKPVLFIAALLIIGGLVLWLPMVQWMTAFFAWVAVNPQIAWLIFAAFYIAAVVLLLPGSLLTLSAGFLFGLGSGFIICSISSVLGATLAFLLGRFLARDWVAAKLLEMPRFAALDRAIGKRSAIIVLLTRLSPIFPFNLINYALGLTGVSLRTYVLASWVGMMPGTLLYVYLGSIAKDLGSVLSGQLATSSANTLLFYAGLIATLVLTVIIARLATKALNEQLQVTGEGEGYADGSNQEKGARL